MTLNDLLQNDPYKLPYSGGATWGTPAYQNQQSWLNQQAPDDQVAMMRNVQLNDMTRKIKARADADAAQRKIMFLQQFAGRPVNLYGAPQDQAQAQLQDLVQKDYNARQQGVNNMQAFQNQTNALDERRLKYAQGRNSLLSQQMNNRLLGQTVRDKFDPNSYENQQEQLRLQSAHLGLAGQTQGNEAVRRQLADAAFNQALSLVKGGSDISVAMINGLNPDQVDMLKNYKDAQDRILQRQQDALAYKQNPPPTPNEIRLSDNALQKYGGMQNRANILTAKAQKYTQDVAREQQAAHGWFYNMMNPFEGSGRGSAFVGTPAFGGDNTQGNPADVTAQLSGFVSPTKPQDYVNTQLANDKISSQLIHQGPNGLESLLAQRPQAAPQAPMNNAPGHPLIDYSTGQPESAGLPRNAAGDYQVSTQADVDLVPAGSVFITPSGSRKIKPMAVPSANSGFLDSIRQQLPGSYAPDPQQTYFSDREMPTGPQRTFFGPNLNPTPY